MYLSLFFQLQTNDFPKHAHSCLQNVVREIKHRVVQCRLLQARTQAEEADGADAPEPSEVLRPAERLVKMTEI